MSNDLDSLRIELLTLMWVPGPRQICALPAENTKLRLAKRLIVSYAKKEYIMRFFSKVCILLSLSQLHAQKKKKTYSIREKPLFE
jgi:hypothetical protein